MLSVLLSYVTTLVCAVVVLGLARFVYKRVRVVYTLDDRVVLLTGASAGIGEQLAKDFARAGNGKNRVVVVARREELLQKLCMATNKALGREALSYVAADLTQQSECRRIVDECVARHGRLDVLVLNAGRGSVARFDTYTESTLTEIDGVMRLNYWSPVWTTFYAQKHLRAARGAIVAISSLASKLPTPTRCGYAPTKAALNSFFDAFRSEQRGAVTVQVVCPGFVLTEIHDKMVTTQKARRADYSQFLTVDACSRAILAGLVRGDRETIVGPALAHIGDLMRFFAPEFVEWMVRRKSEQAIKLD